jgi:pimeloyl-ACP methyl ester carboxylesterase
VTTERTVEAGDRAIAVLEAGDPRGVPVFVHHGTPFSRVMHSAWQEDAAAREIRLISHDRPGFGGSDRLRGRSVSDVAEDVEAIADALDVDRFTTWGWSGGGPHALACAALLPDRVAAVATLASLAQHDVPGLDFLAGMEEGNVQVLRLAAEDPDALPGVLLESREPVLSNQPPGYLHESMSVALEPGIDGWLDDLLALVRAWGFEPAAIQAPLLLLHGRQDTAVPPAHTEWLAERVPGCETRLPDADHLTLLDEAVGETHDWLRRQV